MTTEDYKDDENSFHPFSTMVACYFPEDDDRWAMEPWTDDKDDDPFYPFAILDAIPDGKWSLGWEERPMNRWCPVKKRWTPNPIDSDEDSEC